MTRTPAAIITFLALASLAACADPNYATPEKTVQTYVENAQPLKNSVDIPAWNFTWGALSESSRSWFDENWEAICARPGYREACGAQSNPEKQRMVAFGAAIAGRGPQRNCKIEGVDVDGDTAEVELSKWNGTLYLVKEGGEWKIDGLFGVEELASNAW